jgi:hypothetical protein
VPKLWIALVAAAVALPGCALGAAGPPRDVTGAGATLPGTVFSSAGGDTDYWFRYGPAAGYGSETPRKTVAIEGDEGEPVSEVVRGLDPATSYHVQMCARDEDERVVCGKDQSFTTLNEDSLTGRFSNTTCYSGFPPYCNTIVNVFDAYRGPSGGGVHGSARVIVSSTQEGGEATTYDWEPTCLNVAGNRATIALTAPPEWTGPTDYARLWVTDTDGQGNDLILYELRETATTECPIEPAGQPAPEQGTGDYFVRDAQP